MRWELIPASSLILTHSRSSPPPTPGLNPYSKANLEGPVHTLAVPRAHRWFLQWLQRPSLPQPPPIEPGEHGLFGDIAAPAKRTPKPKPGSRPVYKFKMSDGAPYALAGLFSEWRPRKGSPHPPLDTFSIVTTEANELMEPIHNRMPVILNPRDYDRWLMTTTSRGRRSTYCARTSRTASA